MRLELKLKLFIKGIVLFAVFFGVANVRANDCSGILLFLQSGQKQPKNLEHYAYYAVQNPNLTAEQLARRGVSLDQDRSRGEGTVRVLRQSQFPDQVALLRSGGSWLSNYREGVLDVQGNPLFAFSLIYDREVQNQLGMKVVEDSSAAGIILFPRAERFALSIQRLRAKLNEPQEY
jgi:hypothetical protein